VITISVESDDEQQAIGAALVDGTLGFGGLPFQVRRAYSLGPGGGAGWAAGGGVGFGGANAVVGGGGNGGYQGSGFVTGGTGASGGGGAGGGPATVADSRWNLGSPLRPCCATMPGTGHREGCAEP